MRKVFLEDLPHGGSRYIPNNRVNWTESIGEKVKFIYEDIEGYLEIIDYIKNKSMLTVKYNDNQFDIFTGHLNDGKLGKIIGKITSKHVYNVNDIVEVKSGNIKIINQRKVKMGNEYIRGYDYRCLNCNFENHITEGHLKEKLGCSVCMKQKVKIGFNDMWSTNPDLAKLLNDPNDGFKYMQNSNKRVDWKCPNCLNLIKNRKISHINNNGILCPKCSDTLSYPEKFTYNVLSQLDINFETQKIFPWSNNKRYDFYLKGLNLIIEVHGIQHYEKSHRGRSLEEEQENDTIKKSLAEENGIYYITLDCRYSDMDFIRKNIQNSELNNFFDLSMINWLECHEFCCSTLVRTSCDLWTKGIRNTREIGEILNLGRGAVCRYLKRGEKIGWCDYSVEKVRLSQLKKMQQKRKRPIICITTNEEFNSIKEASEKYKINNSHITSACKGDYKTSGGFKWMYKEDYDNLIHT